MVGNKENHLLLSVFIIGFTCMITQIIVLRSFFITYASNELAMGIVLSNWLLITACGSYAGNRSGFLQNREGFLFASHLLIGIFPLVTVFLVYYTRFQFFPHSSLVSLMDIFLLSLALLLPFCFITGFLFSFLNIQISLLRYSNQMIKTYSTDAIGAIAGGLVFNFILLFAFDDFVSLKILMACNFGIALFVTQGTRSGLIRIIIGILAIALAGGFFMINPKPIADSYLFRSQNIINQKVTPYGHIVVTEMAGQNSYFENGVFLYSTNNTINNEESVHYAMLQHPRPENVLLISGGIPGTIAEVMKYNIRSLDYIEINPGLIGTGKQYLSRIHDKTEVQIIGEDARFFLRNPGKSYDVVLINLPDPVNTHINRYYTLEFLEEVKQRLSGNAVISLSLSSTAIYLSEEAQQLHAALFSTLKLLFANVIIIPGMNNFFIASDGVVTSDIALLSKYKEASNTYVNSIYLDDELIRERRARLENIASQEIIINYDFFPVVHLLHLRFWSKKLKFESILAGALVLIVLALIIPRLHTVNFGLFTTGFTASSLQILLIVAFQMIYGYVFCMIGIFFTAFVVGVVAGVLFVSRNIRISLMSYSVIQYIFGILAVLVPIAIMVTVTGRVNHVIIHSLFIVFTIFSGLLTGTHFAAGSYLRPETIAGATTGSHSSGLLGAAIGALIFSALLIPYFGIVKAGLLLGIVNFLVGLFILLRSRQVGKI
jgi:spermidine synthase